MNIDDQILFLCTRQVMGAGHKQALLRLVGQSALRWDYIYKAAWEHGVAPLVYANLSQLPPGGLDLPSGVRDQFEQTTQRTRLVKQRTQTWLREVLDYLAAHAIDALLIKGMAASLLVYDQPWYVVMSDVDLILRPRREQLAPKLVQEMEDFFHTINNEPFDDKEYLEFDYYTHHDLTMNGVIPVEIERVWAAAKKTSFQGSPVYLMAPEDLLLATAINACRKRFYRLKSLFDLAEILARLPGLDWEVLADNARRYQCGNILYTALMVTEATLGCSFPADLLPRLGVPAPRAALIRRIIEHLNRNYSLTGLASRSDFVLFKRQLSAPLLLTYATYRWNQLVPKLAEIFTGRNNAY